MGKEGTRRGTGRQRYENAYLFGDMQGEAQGALMLMVNTKMQLRSTRSGNVRTATRVLWIAQLAHKKTAR